MRPHLFNQRRVLFFGLLASLVCFSVNSIPAQQTAPQAGKANPAYEANLEKHTNNSVLRVHLFYDKGRFRQEMIFPGTATKVPLYMEIFDGNVPYLVWSCSLENQTAWPLPISCNQALSLAVQREGVAKTQQRYHVPASYFQHIHAGNTEPPHPSSGLKTKADFPALNLRRVGQETVAGYRCDIYESQTTQNVESSRDGVPGNHMARQTEHVRAWVEPRTGLVLRLATGTQPAPGSPVPPLSHGYVVTKLRLPASIPAERFQLPSGVTANVAEIFDAVKLPPGVKRVRAAGKSAYIGMEIN